MPDNDINEVTRTATSPLQIMQLQQQVIQLAMVHKIIDQAQPYTKELGAKVVQAVQADMQQGLEDYNALTEADQKVVTDMWASRIEAQNSQLPADQKLPVGGYDEKGALAVLRLEARLANEAGTDGTPIGLDGASEILGSVGYTDYADIYGVIIEIDAQTRLLDATFEKYTFEQLTEAATQELAQLTAQANQNNVAPVVPELSATEIADNKVVQNTFISVVSDMKDNSLLSGLVEGIDISKMRTDGTWDEASLKVVNDSVEMIQKAMELDGQFPEQGYEAGLGAAVEQKMEATSAFEDPGLKMTLAAFDILLPQNERNTLFAAMENITARDGFQVPKAVVPPPISQGAGFVSGGGQPLPQINTPSETDTEQNTETDSEEVSEPTETQVKLAVVAVEGTLAILTESLDGLAGGLASKLGADDLLKDLFKGADFTDGVWDAKSEDATATVIMGLKVLASEGVDPAKNPYGKNPDGTISPQIAENLTKDILTLPQFQMIRDALNIDTINQEEGTKKISAFFDSVLILEQAHLYSNEQAKQSTKMNLMVDAAGLAMDKWAPGLKTFLVDFFKNNELGQMVAGVMSMFGINIARLWGEKDNSAALENAKPLAEEKFEKLYNDISNDLNSTNHVDIMAQMKSKMQDDLFDDWRFKGGMKIFFRGQDEGTIQAAIEKATDAAANSSSLEDAKALFSQSLYEQGVAFQTGQDLDVQSGLSELRVDVQQVGEDIPTTRNPGAAGLVNSTNQVVKPDIDAASRDENGLSRVRDHTAAAVNADTSEFGDKKVEFIYTPNTTEYQQIPYRYSEGRFGPIQKVLGDNQAALELSLGAQMMQKSGGDYTDTATRGTNALIEETLIRAQLHDMTEKGLDITEETLKGLDRKMGVENLPVVLAYMTDKGVSQADRDVFEKNIKDLGADYKSTISGQPDAGPVQNVTVLDQVIFGNQFDLNVAQWVTGHEIDPNADDVNVDDPDASNRQSGIDIPTDTSRPDLLRDRYLEHQKGRTDCEHPLFYTKEGSDAVYAIIRDKGGDSDPTNDIFISLKFDDYLKTFDIKNSDADDINKLFDNYNFDPPTEAGVRDYINKVLCLDPTAADFDANAQENQKVEEPQNSSSNNTNFYTPHQVPETFAGPRRPLRELTDSQANYLVEALHIEGVADIGRRADKDIRHPVELMFERSLPSIPGRNSEQSGFAMLELSAFKDENGNPLSHPEFDVVIAMRHANGRMDIRYVQYEEDYIRPLDNHRTAPDMFETCPPQSGPRRLDDFLDEIARLPGGRILQGVTNGYEPMKAIVPSDGGGMKTIGALQAVYGPYGVREQREYLGAYRHRADVRTAYESDIRQGRAGSSRGNSKCFNDKSGHVKPWSPGGRTNRDRLGLDRGNDDGRRGGSRVFNSIFRENHVFGPRSEGKQAYYDGQKIDRIERRIERLEDKIDKLSERNSSGRNDNKIEALERRIDDLQVERNNLQGGTSNESRERLEQQIRDTGTDSDGSAMSTRRDLRIGSPEEEQRVFASVNN